MIHQNAPSWSGRGDVRNERREVTARGNGVVVPFHPDRTRRKLAR